MLNCRILAVGILACWVAACSVDAQAGAINLWGIADGDSIYLEQQSDAFFQMDLYDPPPRETQQRFHAISNPSIQFGSLAFDGFPNDENFRLGSVTYDESGVVGGNGIAPITALSLGIGYDPADPSYINYGRWDPIETVVDSFSGTVSIAGGIVTGINLTSSVHLEINPLPTLSITAPGTFNITGDFFEGYMETPSTGPNTQLIWDFSGTLTTVPEPATWLLALMGIVGFVGIRIPGIRRGKR